MATPPPAPAAGTTKGGRRLPARGHGRLPLPARTRRRHPPAFQATPRRPSGAATNPRWLQLANVWLTRIRYESGMRRLAGDSNLDDERHRRSPFDLLKLSRNVEFSTERGPRQIHCPLRLERRCNYLKTNDRCWRRERDSVSRPPCRFCTLQKPHCQGRRECHSCRGTLLVFAR